MPFCGLIILGLIFAPKLTIGLIVAGAILRLITVAYLALTLRD